MRESTELEAHSRSLINESPNLFTGNQSSAQKSSTMDQSQPDLYALTQVGIRKKFANYRIDKKTGKIHVASSAQNDKKKQKMQKYLK